jgi:hypothetical protein
MDLSRFKTSDYLMIGGAVGFLVFGIFGDWVKLAASGKLLTEMTDNDEPSSGTAGNAFDFLLTGALPMLLAVAVGVIALLLAMNSIRRESRPWPLILLACSALGVVLILALTITGPSTSAAADLVRSGTDGFADLGDELANSGYTIQMVIEKAEETGNLTIGRGIGLWLSLVAAVVVLVGAALSFKESGGKLDDLRDVNTLKSAFGQGQSGSTPPTSPAAPPPPPA